MQLLAPANSPPGTGAVPLQNNTAPLLEATSVSYGSDTTLLGPNWAHYIQFNWS